MNTADVIRRVQRGFGDNNESQIYINDIIDWINDGQMEIVRQTQCLQKTASFDIVSGAENGPFPLPADFLFERRVTYNNVTLTVTSLPELDEFNQAVDNLQPGGVTVPNYYYIWGQALYIHPAPAAPVSQPLKTWYINAPTTISIATDSLSIPPSFHEDVVRFALMRARELNEDYSGADRLQSEFEQRMGKSRDQSQHPYDSYPVVRDYQGDYWEPGWSWQS